ncbi:MAG: HD domain-containing protein, partial [bacterium]
MSNNQNDWRPEVNSSLNNCQLYNHLEEKCENDEYGSNVMSLVNNMAHDAYERSKLIIKHMGEYTLHDGTHIFSILNIMNKILPNKTIEKLSTPELMLLILTAFFHDIGMAPAQNKVSAWKEAFNEMSFDDTKDHLEYNDFLKFIKSKPKEKKRIDNLNKSGQNEKANILKNNIISEYIRKTHAIRTRSIIEENWNNEVVYKDLDLTKKFAQLCYSHNEDARSLLEMDSFLLSSPNTFICLPFIGVILRLSDLLDFDPKRTPKVLFDHLDVKNPTSLKEWEKHRSINSWHITNSRIVFQASCKHPAIEASIRKFCDYIDEELMECTFVLRNLNKNVNESIPEYYNIDLPTKVDRSKIRPEEDFSGSPKYIYKNTKFTLSKSQVIDLLMGTKLYGNTKVALRELIQNSIDACLTREKLEQSWNNSYNPKIIVEYDNENSILKIEDNGIGMDKYIIENYYSKVGSSYYTSSDFYTLKAENNVVFTPISRFGIGILSCFMVADSLEVSTKKVYEPYESSEPLKIIVEGYESIFWIKSGKRKEPGTTTKLDLRKDDPWKLNSFDKFKDTISKTIPNPKVPIIIKFKDNTYTYTEETFKEKLKEFQNKNSWEKNSFTKFIDIKLDNNEGITGFIQ